MIEGWTAVELRENESPRDTPRRIGQRLAKRISTTEVHASHTHTQGSM